MRIKKAIIPVAGKGTRFLPATKETPKEMLPILNIPMIHYVVKEAVDAGIEEVIFVISDQKESLLDYFRPNQVLEKFLSDKHKEKELKLIKEIGSMVTIKTVQQKEQLGLGHAVLMGKSVIDKDELFAVLLGDDLTLSEKPVIKQLMDISNENENGSVIGVMEVPREDTGKYGIVAGDKLTGNLLKLTEMVEKPSPEKAPTTLATPGRYILPEKIFGILESIPRGVGGEYQLTDAINELAKVDKVFAYIFEGDRFDTGNVKSHFEATIEFALRDENLREYALKLLKEKVKKYEN